MGNKSKARMWRRGIKSFVSLSLAIIMMQVSVMEIVNLYVSASNQQDVCCFPSESESIQYMQFIAENDSVIGISTHTEPITTTNNVTKIQAETTVATTIETSATTLTNTNTTQVITQQVITPLQTTSTVVTQPTVIITKSIVTEQAMVPTAQDAILPETCISQVEGIIPEVKTMTATAYCPCAKCCGKCTGITASGEVATQWCTIGASTQYPFGTIIYIPSLADKPNMGWFIVQDRGGKISNNKIDIFFSTHSEAYNFGRKTFECYIYYP